MPTARAVGVSPVTVPQLGAADQVNYRLVIVTVEKGETIW
jgi:hypothetical protein